MKFSIVGFLKKGVEDILQIESWFEVFCGTMSKGIKQIVTSMVWLEI